jgi:CRISPR-associated protein Cst2
MEVKKMSEEKNTKTGEENIEGNSQNKGRKYIVLDVVFYGSSLNYDKGQGNYQELKKITKWDGKQYSLVSRYALRYSLLETGKNLGLWELTSPNNLQRAGEGEKTVIQPSTNLLLSGEILNYPEFDLFGYLITNTNPQNAREAPVKISHAVSLTPYNYDSHFCGNLGLAKRMIESTGKMDPNLFTIEEHQTYYIYTVVIDVDRIGQNEVYLLKKEDNKEKKWKTEVKEDGDVYKIEIEAKSKETVKGHYEVKRSNNGIVIAKSDLENVYLFTQRLVDRNKVKDKIARLIKSILYLNRNIKGRNETLHPKLLIAGFYNGKPYKSYKDKIILSDQYEEIYEEKNESTKDNEIRIVRKVVKLRKPLFKIVDSGITQERIKTIDEAEKLLLEDGNQSSENKSLISKLFSDGSLSEIYVFRAPEVNVE